MLSVWKEAFTVQTEKAFDVDQPLFSFLFIDEDLRV